MLLPQGLRAFEIICVAMVMTTALIIRTNTVANIKELFVGRNIQAYQTLTLQEPGKWRR